MTICGLMLTSCEMLTQKDGGPFEVSVRNTSVGAEKGQQFVNVKCSGDWTLDLVSDEENVDWAKLNVTSGTGNKSNVILSYDANSSEKGRTLTIALDNGRKSVFCSMEQAAARTQPGDGSDVDPDPKPSGSMDLTKTGWMELPEMNDAELDYYTHSFKMDGKKYRNYSFGYSKKDYLAVWVAYPLCSVYTSGSVSGGGDDWSPNPLIDSDDQPNFYRSFGFSKGYERGHQIANADRKCCSEANNQTFYYTNATLQHKNFNGPIWGDLEGDLRTVANTADTLYVVTGCVVSDNPEYIRDSDNHNVPIPSGYFKAALRYKNGDSVGTWLSAAFYYDHKTYVKEVMTVDALEERLGMNFFVNFETKYGDAASKVEAQDPNKYKSVWKLN